MHAAVILSACAIGTALAIGPARAQAPIVTDGTMGARVELNGPAMQITHTLGTQADTNLFHSFQRFNIPTLNSATFTGPGGIENVISRVTGGEASTIDGAFRSTIPGAAVWFTNPAGVTFGPNASLDVPASFHASTANEIRFPDGGRFSADLGATSTLSVAPPEAFGFLSSNPAPLKVERSQLSVETDATLSLAAGEIDIQGNAPPFPEGVDFTAGTLRAPSGTINLASVAGPAEVKTDGIVSGNHHGAIRLTDGARVDASGAGAGVVRIRGGEVTLTGSLVDASNTGSAAGAGGIDISADQLSLQDGLRSPSLVAANAHSAGDAVPINVRAQDIKMQNSRIQSLAHAAGKAGDIHIDAANQMTLDNFAGVFASSLSLDPSGTGGGGDITVNAGNLVIRGQSQIGSITIGPAPAGDITVTAGTLLADGPSPYGQQLTGISAPADSRFINGQNTTPGKAGNITVNADEIRLTNGAQITSFTEGPLDAGIINVIVDSGTLTIENGSRITTITYAAGKAGDITVTTGTLLADGPSPYGQLTGISAAADSRFINGQNTTSGKAGNITVNADEIRLTNGAQITSFTEGPLDAGIINVIVDSGTLTIENGSRITTITYASGKAGMVNIRANNLTLKSPNTRISSESIGSRSGEAGTIILTGVSKLFMFDGADVTTQSGSAGGGDIEIRDAGIIVLRDGSRINVNTEAGAQAGNITIGSRFLVLDRSFISADAKANSGGNIRISSDSIFRSPDSQITARAGPAGIAGTVVLTSPETDVTGDLAQLPGEVMNTADQMQVRCAARGGVEGSSFTIADPETLSPALEGYLAGTYAGVADEDAAVTDGSFMVASGGLAFPVWTVACGEAR